MSIYPIFTPNQQNKCSKPSMNHQEQNRMKHRKQLKTHLGSLDCNWSFPASSVLFLQTIPQCVLLQKESPLTIFSSLTYIYQTPSKNPPNLLEENPTFLSYFLPFCNRFPHGNNIRAILLKTKSPLFQNYVDSPSKQMAARFLMPKKPRNMIQKTCNKKK